MPVPHKSVDTSSFAVLSWYRKHSTLPAAWQEKRITLSFEGVAKVAAVYCNGVGIGEYRGAYTSFTCDITELPCAVAAICSQCGAIHGSAGIFHQKENRPILMMVSVESFKRIYDQFE